MDWLDYREKLGIGFHDKEKGKYFIQKILNYLEILASNRNHEQINEGEYFKFCNITGIKLYIPHSSISDNYRFTEIIDILKDHSESLQDFLTYYIPLINCQKDSVEKDPGYNEFINLIRNMLEESHIMYEIFEDDDGCFVFPKGIEEFDKALVSEPLKWLSSYPKTEKAWSKALREYADKNDQNSSDIADLFRKALETFLQEFFKKDGKVIKNFISDYGDYLKGKNIPPEIRNNFQKLLDGYDHYMDNYAKHRDATSDKVLEYLMYETGNIIRLIITLDKN